MSDAEQHLQRMHLRVACGNIEAEGELAIATKVCAAQWLAEDSADLVYIDEAEMKCLLAHATS